MKILAIDPGLCCGFASNVGRIWGVQKFPKRPWRHPFAHFLDFRAWLVQKIETLEIEALAVEGVISTGGYGNGQRKEWHGIILAAAAECDLPVATVYPSQLKKYATGNGRADRPEMQIALREKFQLDLPADEHDAIAAIWVLSWATQEARAGRIGRSWTGKPRTEPEARRTACNRCTAIFVGGEFCPRCGSARLRLEA